MCKQSAFYPSLFLPYTHAQKRTAKQFGEREVEESNQNNASFLQLSFKNIFLELLELSRVTVREVPVLECAGNAAPCHLAEKNLKGKVAQATVREPLPTLLGKVREPCPPCWHAGKPCPGV